MSFSERIRRIWTPAIAAHIAEGRRGEDIAARYLRDHDYRIIDRNVRIGRDEIDIIAYDPIDRVLIFAEVKTRTRADDDYRPELNITHKKRARMSRAARRYMAKSRVDDDVGYRLDVLCVADGTVIEHYPEVAWTNG
ncbi:MAG TPA: YraN family protein [Candidatus Peribacteraceae bacterium]|nr:YraN family protein [Candidatus Peribacteraceae bacterium]